MNELMHPPASNLAEITYVELSPVQKLEVQLDIVDESIRRRDLARLEEMEIVPVTDLPSLEEDVISNVRLFKITEMVYQKGEPVTDKFTTVFNTLNDFVQHRQRSCQGRFAPLLVEICHYSDRLFIAGSAAPHVFQLKSPLFFAHTLHK